jgi:hypothetical protein
MIQYIIFVISNLGLGELGTKHFIFVRALVRKPGYSHADTTKQLQDTHGI